MFKKYFERKKISKIRPRVTDSARQFCSSVGKILNDQNEKSFWLCKTESSCQRKRKCRDLVQATLAAYFFIVNNLIMHFVLMHNCIRMKVKEGDSIKAATHVRQFSFREAAKFHFQLKGYLFYRHQRSWVINTTALFC